MGFDISFLDVFPKLRVDQARKTTFSGIISTICTCVMVLLGASLTFKYIVKDPKQRLIVDTAPLPRDENGVLDYEKQPKIAIHFNIEFPSLPCPFIDVGVLDSYKELQDDQYSKIKLKRFSANGQRIKNSNFTTPHSGCGNCYGLRSGCCNTCKEVRRAYKDKGRTPPPLNTIEQCKDVIDDWNKIKDEKCVVEGYVIAPPIESIFYIAPGDSYNEKNKHLADYESIGLTPDDFNLTHKINEFYIGDEKTDIIDGTFKLQNMKGRMKSLYFVRSVKERVGEKLEFHTSITHYERYREGQSNKFPGVFFMSEISPIIVVTKRDRSVLRFLVDVMAIVGGVFSIGTLLDRFVTKGSSPHANTIQ